MKVLPFMGQLQHYIVADATSDDPLKGVWSILIWFILAYRLAKREHGTPTVWDTILPLGSPPPLVPV
jgi:hypothetical protein